MAGRFIAYIRIQLSTVFVYLLRLGTDLLYYIQYNVLCDWCTTDLYSYLSLKAYREIEKMSFSECSTSIAYVQIHILCFDEVLALAGGQTDVPCILRHFLVRRWIHS